jgi:hypothetical protein
MMGPKTLGTIKKELRESLAKTGQDPIDWLEQRIQLLEKAKVADEKQIELLRQLSHVLKDAAKARPKARRTRRTARP